MDNDNIKFEIFVSNILFVFIDFDLEIFRVNY